MITMIRRLRNLVALLQIAEPPEVSLLFQNYYSFMTPFHSRYYGAGKRLSVLNDRSKDLKFGKYYDSCASEAQSACVSMSSDQNFTNYQVTQ